MRRYSQRQGLSTLSEINVTPLLDLAFVLLIIFMITTPLIENSMNLIIPSSGVANTPVNASQVQTISIDRNEALRLNDKPIDAETLATSLAQLKHSNPDLAVVIRPGAFYGWPRCWPNARRLHLSGSCGGVTRPAAYLEPHASADGLAFYRGDLYVAEWGQYLSHRFGRRVVRVQLRPNGTARRVTTFASGFAHPLALLADRDGGLLVADWGRGIVYRITPR